MIDLASWINRRGLAEAIVFQFQPGRLLRLEEGFPETNEGGFLSERLLAALDARGLHLGEGAYLTPKEPDRWRLRDGAAGMAYEVLRREGGFDVLVREPPPDLPAAAFVELGRDCAARLQAFQPHLVGFRVEGAEIDALRRRVEAVRSVIDAQIVLGGPTATSHPRETLLATGADYVFAHEAEESFARFLALAMRSNDFTEVPTVPGLVYRYANEVFYNETPRDGYGRPLDAPGSIPPPAPPTKVLRENRLDWDLLENFRTPMDGLHFTGGRGCPGECIFCARLHGPRARTKTARQLIDEVAGADQLVRQGRLRVSRWPLFEHARRPDFHSSKVSWASVYDEDFFLHRRRAVEFFGLWEKCDLASRYRLGFQTNPRSLLDSAGNCDRELFAYFGKLAPMIQLGAESFHPEVLSRWRKRHAVEELETVLSGLDATGHDYNVFILWSDFETAVEELLESLRLLAEAAWRHPKMRIASSPYTIPLYQSDLRRSLEFRSDSGGLRARSRRNAPVSVWDFERPQPGWMHPVVAELADLIDESLRNALHLPTRDDAILEAVDRAKLYILRTRRADWISRVEWISDRVTGGRIEAGLEPHRSGPMEKLPVSRT